MSAAAAAAPAAAPRKGRKTLIVVLAAVVLLLGAAGGGALWWMSRSAAALEADDEDLAEAERAPAFDPKAAPIFVPLEVFTVNLADRDVDRYAQIGITLEVKDDKVADQLKVYMPAIRNNILMVLAHKTSAELLQREGKEKLAAEIRRETLRPLGIEVEPDDDAAGAGDEPPRRKARRAARTLPVTQVHFSNFIIQ
jgi:flagellar FliL protein